MPLERRIYEFGPYRLDTFERGLLPGDERIPLTPKAFETLLALLENAGRALQKGELLRRVWPDTIVEEVGLARNISVLRKLLGDDQLLIFHRPDAGLAEQAREAAGRAYALDPELLIFRAQALELGWPLPTRGSE